MSGDEASPLSAVLGRALEVRGLDVDLLAERTKVPRATIRALLGSMEPAVLPQRIYLRGHLAIIARELALDVDATLARFDREQPAAAAPAEAAPKANRAGITVAAGLGCIALVAVILAFVR